MEIGLEIEKSVQNACRQMQTVWDSKCVQFIVFWKNLFFTKRKVYGLKQDMSSIKFLVVSDLEALLE